MYNTRTGEITVVLPNNHSIGDVEHTVLHEGAVHYGLRQMFGRNFDRFLDDVYNGVDGNTRATIDESARANGWSKERATEEYLGDLSDGMDWEKKPSLWQRIKGWFMEMLRRAGLSRFLRISDNDLRYYLWRSREDLRQRRRGVVETMADIEKQRELQVGDFAERAAEGRGGWLRSLPVERLAGREPVVVAQSVLVDAAKHKNLNRRLRGGELEKYRMKALRYATDNHLFGTYINESNGRIEISFDKKGRGKINGGLKELLYKATTGAEIEVALAVPELIKNGVYIGSADNFKKDKKSSILRCHYYICGLRIGGEDYVVHMNIAEDRDGNRYYDHQLVRQKNDGLPKKSVVTSSPEVSSDVQMSEAANNELANRGEVYSVALTSMSKGSKENVTTKGNGGKNDEALLYRRGEDEGASRARGSLREGEGLFDRASAVSRDYLAELARSREEALAAKSKEERAMIQTRAVQRRVDAVLERLKNATAAHKQDESLTRRAVSAFSVLAVMQRKWCCTRWNFSTHIRRKD